MCLKFMRKQEETLGFLPVDVKRLVSAYGYTIAKHLLSRTDNTLNRCIIIFPLPKICCESFCVLHCDLVDVSSIIFMGQVAGGEVLSFAEISAMCPISVDNVNNCTT